MSDLTDLVTWLRAQLDDDEAEAREALKRRTTERRMIQGRMVDVRNQPMPEWRRSVWPPERVLAGIDAKRRIITAIYDRKTWRDDPPAQFIDLDIETRVLELLALPYADRPGYQESWRP